MIRSASPTLCAAACTLLLCCPSLAQTRRHAPTPGSAPASAKASQSAAAADSSAQQLASLLTAQARALQVGDPALISEATRPLIADLLRQLAKVRLLQGKTSEAADLYRQSLQFADSTDTRLELASALLRDGKAQDAVTETAAVVQADPQSASAWAIHGSALRSAGNEKDAIEAFNRSLKLHPDVNVAYALASSLLAAHEKQKADSILAQIISGSGNAAIWHVAAGDAYREALYLTDAVDEFKKAIAIDPAVGHAEFFLGLTYLQMNQWGPTSQSFEHLRAAVRLAPHEYLSNFYLGAIESTVGSDLGSSNRHLHVAAEANPASPEAWLYLGLNAVREKNTTDAKLYLRKAIDLTGADEARNNFQIRRVYAVLGRILISEGNHAEGDALLASYKRTEQQALRENATAIAQSADADLARSAIGGVASARASFPGMSSASSLPQVQNPSAPGASAPNQKQVPNQTPEQTREIAAAEQKLRELLAGSLNDLGTAEARQAQYDVALTHFQQAEQWHAPAPTLLRNLGVAAFRTGDFKESARALGLYLQAHPAAAHDDRSHIMLGMSLFSLGQFAEADKAFSSIPDHTLEDPRAAYSWAFSLAHSGQQQHADQIADTLARQQLPLDVMSLVCHLYMDTENYDRSLACFRNPYKLDPTLKLAHFQAAESLIRLDRPAEAVPELRAELALSPDNSDNPDVQYSLAFALLQSSHKDEALTILRNLTSSHPTHAQAQYQLGKSLLESGNNAEAVTHLELAEQNDPGPDYIHYQLQAAYRKVGRTEDADRELRLYRDIKSRSREAVPSPH